MSTLVTPVEVAVESGLISPKPVASLVVDDELGHPSYRVREVSQSEWRRKAGRLIKRMYSWRGYRTGIVSALPDRPTWITLETSKGKQVFGTLSLGLDSTEGLFADALFRNEV